MRVLLMLMTLMVNPTDHLYEELIILDDSKIIARVSKEDLSYSPLNLGIVDEKRMETIYDNLKDVVFKAPTNALFNGKDNIVIEETGYQLDREILFERLQQFYYQGTINEIEVPKQILYPKVTSELLAHIKQHKINSYITNYETKHGERSHNISLATEAINNTVVFPGETFSFNQVVGERTEDKGYKKAPVIIKGELSEDVGGGICQVSSTLFNAVNLKGVQMIERYSHSKQVPYVPPGKDAAVSWWGPDFAFENQYREPILIRAFAKEGQVQIHIYAAFE